MPPGWSHFSRWWNTPIRPLWEALARRYRLILYDARGQGSSERGLKEGHSVEDYELDLEAVLESAGATNVALLAFSVSTRVAVRFAAAHPDRVHAIALWGASPTPAWSSESLASLARSDWETFIRISSRTAIPFADHTIAEPIMRDAVAQADWEKMVRAMARKESEDHAARVVAPVLIFSLFGAGLFADPDAQQEVAHRFPTPRLIALREPGLGLLPRDPASEPHLALAIEAFLDEAAPIADYAGSRRNLLPADIQLSPRELEVLRLVAAGKTNAQIATELVISQNTATKHVAAVLSKTGAANRAEATAVAVRNGLA
jgi:DNA-binding CsgD family transcriptional regulator